VYKWDIRDIFIGLWADFLALAPTLRGPTADKREIKDFPKLPSITSFIRETLSEIALRPLKVIKQKRR